MNDEGDAEHVRLQMRATGQALIEISEALKGLTKEQAMRVIRASAILHNIDLASVGLQEIR